MEVFISLAPILFILAMLFLLKQSALRAGLAAYVLTLGIVLSFSSFQLGGTEILRASTKGALTASLVAYVLLFGIMLYHLMNGAGLIRAIASFIARATSDPVRQVLMLVVAFSPLVESVSGFGIAVIVVAPILVSLGFDRFRAAVLGLVSLTAVPWGALATGTVIAGNLGGLSVQEVGIGTALLALPTFVYFAFVSVWIGVGWKGVRSKGLEILTVAGALGLGVWFSNRFVSVELAGAVGALAAIGVEYVFIRFSGMNDADPSAANREPILRAMSPYLMLTVFLFVTRLVPPAEGFFTTHLVWDLPDYAFRLPLLYSPGFALLLACLYTMVVFGMSQAVVRVAIRSTLKQWIPVAFSTTAFIAMAEVMFASGMTQVLAQGAAMTFGAGFLFLSPLIGGLGGFLTGSNAAANAMLIKLQVETAAQLGIQAEIFACAQNTSASHMTMASPMRVLLGATVCQLQSEGSLLLGTMVRIALGALGLVILGLAFRFTP